MAGAMAQLDDHPWANAKVYVARQAAFDLGEALHSIATPVQKTDPAEAHLRYGVGDDGKLQWMSPFTQLLVGYNEDDIRGVPVLAIFPQAESDRVGYIAICLEARAHPDQPQPITYRIPARDGHMIDCLPGTTVTWNANGRTYVLDCMLSELEQARGRGLLGGPQFRTPFELLRMREFVQDRHMRAVAREIVQEELYEQTYMELETSQRAKKKPAKPDKTPKPKTHSSYPDPKKFDAKIRAAVKELADPQNMEKVTIPGVCKLIDVCGNILWELLQDYGYAHKPETCSRALKRLAAEWHPEWKGINRHRR